MALPFGVMAVMSNLTELVHSSRNLPPASQAAPNDTKRRLIRNNPTQAKRRLEWATPSFSWSFLSQLAAGKSAPRDDKFVLGEECVKDAWLLGGRSIPVDGLLLRRALPRWSIRASTGFSIL
jgi:hypothetical protein